MLVEQEFRHSHTLNPGVSVIRWIRSTVWTTLHRIMADHGRGPDAPSACNTSVYVKDSTTAQWGNLMVVGSIPTSGVLYCPSRMHVYFIGVFKFKC